MSYQTEKFQNIKNMVKAVDKYAEFMVNFNVNKMKVCSKLVNKKVELLNIFLANKIVHISTVSKDLINVYIDL